MGDAYFHLVRCLSHLISAVVGIVDLDSCVVTRFGMFAISIKFCCCVSVLRPFDTFNVISGAVCYTNYPHCSGQASYAVYQYLVHILSSVTTALKFCGKYVGPSVPGKGYIKKKRASGTLNCYRLVRFY